MKKDYYDILWIEKNASPDEIKKAYRKKAMDSHPDRHDGNHEKENEFKVINEAYAVLSDPDKKNRYDRYGSADENSFGGMGGFDFGNINVEDIFSSVFGNMWGFSSRSGQQKEHGADIQCEIHLTFSESYSGVKKELKFDKITHCDTCRWLGTKDGKEPSKCGTCHGSGYVSRTVKSIFWLMQQTLACEECRWEWVIIEHKCSECRGSWTKMTHSIQTFDIPAGIDEGMTLKLSWEWNITKHWNGDLYITCHVDQHQEILRRNGNNIFTTLHISPAEATLGVTKKIKFPLIGERQVTIAPATQHGKKILLTNDGMPLLGKKWRGDLVITFEITIPGKISKWERKLYEELLDLENN